MNPILWYTVACMVSVAIGFIAGSWVTKPKEREFTHVVVTKEGDDVKLYINGERVHDNCITVEGWV